MRAGVLALQGDFAAHLRALPAGAVEVRTAAEVDALDLLVLPGGESTTMLKLLEGSGIEEAVRRLVARGGVVFGTCAGAILLAKDVANPAQRSWGLVDVGVERNAFGRQVDSFEAVLEPDYAAVFIRAPRIRRVARPAVPHHEEQRRPQAAQNADKRDANQPLLHADDYAAGPAAAGRARWPP